MALFSGRDSEAAFKSPIFALFMKTLAIASFFLIFARGFGSGYPIAALLALLLSAAGLRYAWNALAVVLGLFLVRLGLPSTTNGAVQSPKSRPSSRKKTSPTSQSTRP